MSTVIDLSNANFEVLPKEDYPATFDKYEMREGDKGPYANCEFTISDASDYAGRKQWKVLSFSPGALAMTKRNLIAMGADPESFNGPIDVEEILDDLVGNDCTLVVNVRMYEGDEQNEVTRIKSPDYAALAR